MKNKEVRNYVQKCCSFSEQYVGQKRLAFYLTVFIMPALFMARAEKFSAPFVDPPARKLRLVREDQPLPAPTRDQEQLFKEKITRHVRDWAIALKVQGVPAQVVTEKRDHYLDVAVQKIHLGKDEKAVERYMEKLLYKAGTILLRQHS
jgi:hypothetical protein